MTSNSDERIAAVRNDDRAMETLTDGLAGADLWIKAVLSVADRCDRSNNIVRICVDDPEVIERAAKAIQQQLEDDYYKLNETTGIAFAEYFGERAAAAVLAVLGEDQK